jgi:tRNA pseudouridine38-40 synthase
VKFTNYAAKLIGTHDFFNFRKTGTENKTTIRKIIRCDLYEKHYEDFYTGEQKTIYIYEITGNGFLRRMVRNLVGILFDIFMDKITISQFEEMLLTKETQKTNYTTAPAKGLCLVDVSY